MAQLYVDNRGQQALESGIRFGLSAFDQVSEVIAKQKAMQIQQALAESRMKQESDQFQQNQSRMVADEAATNARAAAGLNQNDAHFQAEQQRLKDDVKAKLDEKDADKQKVIEYAKAGQVDPVSYAAATGKVPQSLAPQPPTQGLFHEEQMKMREDDMLYRRANDGLKRAKSALAAVTHIDKFEGTKGPIPGMESQYADLQKKVQDAQDYLDQVNESQVSTTSSRTHAGQSGPQTGSIDTRPYLRNLAGPIPDMHGETRLNQTQPGERVQMGADGMPLPPMEKAPVAWSKLVAPPERPGVRGVLDAGTAQQLLAASGGDVNLAKRLARHIGFIDPEVGSPTSQPAGEPPTNIPQGNGYSESLIRSMQSTYMNP